MSVAEVGSPGISPPRPPIATARRPSPPRLAATAAALLVGDTFRQAIASRTMALAAALAGLGVLACLSVGVEGPRTLRPPGSIELMDAARRPLVAPGPDLGRMTIGFGLARVGNFRDAESQVRFLQAILARWSAGVAGTLILLAGSAGFLPEFLRPGSASILLAKPAPRWALLGGKVAGVLAFVAALTGAFVVGTWGALGLRTGVWSTGYLLAWPLLMAQFAGLYAASVVAATCTRSTAASLFAALACWLVCLGANGARDALRESPGASASPPAARLAVEAAYWALPKPLDLSRMLDRAVAASDHFAIPGPAGGPVAGPGPVAASLASTVAFALAMLAVAARQLATTDY